MTAAVSGTASADEIVADEPRRPEHQAIEIQPLVIAELLPKPTFGVDIAYSVGTETFQARIGAIFAGSPAFALGPGSVANVMQFGQLDLCAAKGVFQHRIRMCVGGQAGAWQHIWRGFSNPGRTLSPWVAGTLRGDYLYSFTERFGLMFGVGVSVPVVGPSFRGVDDYGVRSPVIIPGPVAGSLSVGTSFSFG